MTFRIEVEQEEDGRWIAEILELAGAMADGPTRDDAVARANALALRVVVERLEHGELVRTLRISPSGLRDRLAEHSSRPVGRRTRADRMEHEAAIGLALDFETTRLA